MKLSFNENLFIYLQQMTPQQPHEFAALLITKLENVKRERESEEKLLRIVAEVNTIYLYFTNLI